MSRAAGLRLWLLRRASGLLAGVLLLALVVRVPAFRHKDSWMELPLTYFPMAALALALTPIILTGGIDLSVGSVTVLSAVVVGALYRDVGLPLGLALVGGVLAGLAAGLANGLLVTGGITPLVATLATRELFRGLALALSGARPVEDFPDWLDDFWRAQLAGLPVPLLALALLLVATYLVVHHTWVGRMIFAIGDNEQAARFAGVPVRGIYLGLYAWCGLVAGLCGLANVFHFGSARADGDQTLELLAIACVVLGGVRITGGWGHVFGSALGTVTLAALLTALYNVAATWRDAITGALLVGVALVNEAAARLVSRRTAELSALPEKNLPPALSEESS